MDIKQRDIWFPAKRYGWGWGLPVAWQGWLVLATYVGLIVIGRLSFFPEKHSLAYFAYALGLTIGLTVVCWLKGEKPGWRWGRR